MMRSVFAAVLICGLAPCTALAAEWWHDTFVWAESNGKCGGNDTIAAYSEKVVTRWEGSCTVEKQTKIIGLQAIILNLRCTSEGEDLGTSREVLLDAGDGMVARFPPLRMLRRCSEVTLDEAGADALQTSSQEASAACGYNARLYRTTLFKDPHKDSYQELQFSTGLASGTVDLTEYRQGKAVWSVHGSHTCSNGAVICRVQFPLMLAEDLVLPYEVLETHDGSPEAVVIPSLRQLVYQTERFAVEQGRNYGGLVADLLNGFLPAEDELIAPYNIYRYAGCAKH